MGRLMMKGVMDQQNSCMTVIGVHSTMHLMHAVKSCNYYVCSSLLSFGIDSQ